MIQKPFGSFHSKSHSSLRDIFSTEDLVQIRNASATVPNRDQQHSLSAVFNFEIDGSAACILKGIPYNFRYRRRNTSLRLYVKLECSGDGACSLPGEHYVVLVANVHLEEFHSHDIASERFLATSTVASSRSRVKSRYNIPAISRGCLLQIPGYAFRSQLDLSPSEYITKILFAFHGNVNSWIL